MPAKHQKHRRPTGVQRLTRSIAVAGTGAVALGMFGAAGAHAAAPQHGAQSVPVAAKKAVAGTYTVKKGDSLSKIADKKKVAGGWKKLYKINRDVIGDNPRLIKPGTKLELGKKAAAKPAKAKPAAAAPKTTVVPPTAPPAACGPAATTPVSTSRCPPALR
jgi:LysM repeat protein